MQIVVYGCGYVGLVVGACLADAGFTVICVERDNKRLCQLLSPQLQTDSPELSVLISRNRQAGRLHFTGRAEDASVSIVFVCVGTPSEPDGSPNLSAVHAAIDSVISNATSDTFVFVKSTVPPGTCAALQQRADAAAYPVEIIANPEFLREGSAVRDFIKPERVVAGAESQQAKDCARLIYQRLLGNCDALQLMTPASAELAKYASNAMLATRVALMNDIAIIAEKAGADIDDVRQAVGADSRIGEAFLNSGCGFGGPCFSKDMQSLHYISAPYLESGLFRAALTANRQHQLHALSHLRAFFGERLAGLRGALWGLTYKPNTNDMRNSSAQVIAAALQEAGVTLRAFDPGIANCSTETVSAEMELATSALEAAEDADFIVVCTAWEEFAQVDATALRQVMSQPVVVDACNALEPEPFIHLGFHYRGMGRMHHYPINQLRQNQS